jgi:hypothetical protein
LSDVTGQADFEKSPAFLADFILSPIVYEANGLSPSLKVIRFLRAADIPRTADRDIYHIGFSDDFHIAFPPGKKYDLQE